MVGIRVLIVDDVPELRSVFRIMLESDGRFEVVGEASDGHEAIERAGQLHPDVVTLDIAMPGLDGLRAIPLLHEASPGLRILVLSGFETGRLAREAIERCATAFLSKGVAPETIVSTLHDVYLSPPKKLCGAA
jgi:two-component system, chemotaxis family, chemotaxis protein CheY